MDQLTRIETTVARTDERVESVLKLLEDHGKRIRSLEDTRTKALALMGVLGAAWGYLAKALTCFMVATYVAQGMPPETVPPFVVMLDYVTGGLS